MKLQQAPGGSNWQIVDSHGALIFCREFGIMEDADSYIMNLTDQQLAYLKEIGELSPTEPQQ
jgi:hypothetical protein